MIMVGRKFGDQYYGGVDTSELRYHKFMQSRLITVHEGERELARGCEKQGSHVQTSKMLFLLRVRRLSCIASCLD